MKENIKSTLIAILFFAVLVLSQYLGIYIDRDFRNQLLIENQINTLMQCAGNKIDDEAVLFNDANRQYENVFGGGK